MVAKERFGGCFCGAVRYRVRGEPHPVCHCHCLNCRRSSGAPFVTWAEFDSADLTFVSGEPGTYVQEERVERTFCRECGTSLTYRRRQSSRLDVAVASLDDPESVTPADHLWTSRQLSWIRLDDGLPRYKRFREDTP